MHEPNRDRYRDVKPADWPSTRGVDRVDAILSGVSRAFGYLALAVTVVILLAYITS